MKVNISFIWGCFLILPLALGLTGCNNDSKNNVDDDVVETVTTVEKVFSLSADFAGKTGAALDNAITGFLKHYNKLTAVQKGELANKNVANEYLINRVANVPMRESAVDLLETLKSDFGDKFPAQMTKGSKVPLVLLTNAGNADHVSAHPSQYKSAVTMFYEAGKDQLVKLPADNLALFLKAAAPSEKGTLVDFYGKINNKTLRNVWVSYLFKNKNKVSEEAFIDVLNAAAPKDAVILANMLLMNAVMADQEDATKKHVVELLNNAENWVPSELLTLLTGANFSFKDKSTPTKFLLALASYLVSKHPASALLTEQDVTYLTEVAGALKAKLSIAKWNDHVTADVKTSLMAMVAGADAEAKERVVLAILNEDLAIWEIWNKLITLNLLESDPAIRVANEQAIEAELNKIFTIAEPNKRKLHVAKLVSEQVPQAPKAGVVPAYRGLYLSHIIFQSSFPANTKKKEWVRKILENLPDFDAAHPTAMSKKAWLEQAAGQGASNVGRFAIADLFMGVDVAGTNTRDGDDQATFKAVAILASAAHPNVDDKDSVGPALWNTLKGLNFLMPASSAKGMKYIARVTELPNPAANELRKAIVQYLVAKKDDNGLGLVQNLAMLPDITAKVVDLFKAIVDDQTTATDKHATLEQPGALQDLIDGASGQAGTAPGAKLVATAADLAKRVELIRLFIKYGALKGIRDNYHNNRSTTLFKALLPGELGAATLGDYSDFIKLAKWLDNYSLSHNLAFVMVTNIDAHAAAVKAIFRSAEVNDAKRMTLESGMFMWALFIDIRQVVRNNAPPADMSVGFLALNPKYRYDYLAMGQGGTPLTKFLMLLKEGRDWGMKIDPNDNGYEFLATDSNGINPTFRKGGLMWMLTKIISDERIYNNVYPGIDSRRLKALLITVAEKVKGISTGILSDKSKWTNAINIRTNPGSETAVDVVRALKAAVPTQPMSTDSAEHLLAAD